MSGHKKSPPSRLQAPAHPATVAAFRPWRGSPGSRRLEPPRQAPASVRGPSGLENRLLPVYRHLDSVLRYVTLRRGRDSNPRCLATHTISNRAPSASRTPLHMNGVEMKLRCHRTSAAGRHAHPSAIRAERAGFEPAERIARSPDFESGSFDHSDTSPHTQPPGPRARQATYTHFSGEIKRR